MSTPSTALATRGGQPPAQATGALAIQPYQEMFTDKQKAALSALGIKDASPADLAVYMHVCQRTGLDPFTKQIYMLNRREKQGDQWVTKQTIQVGIDGFRVVRDRAARRDGVDVEYEDTRWYDADGNAYDVWLRPGPPSACGMAVLKGGRRFPAVLTYAEYVQANKDGKPIGKWGIAPAHQLEKCVEAFALRRAFPNDLGGMYIEEEIEPADPDAPPAGRGRVSAQEIAGRRISTARATVIREEAPPPADEPPEPEPAQEKPATPARPTGAMVGKLGKLLGQLNLAAARDQADMLPWLTGRDDATAIEALDRDETVKITKVLSDVLRSHGDADSAASMLWASYHEAMAPASDQAQDGEAGNG